MDFFILFFNIIIYFIKSLNFFIIIYNFLKNFEQKIFLFKICKIIK